MAGGSSSLQRAAHPTHAARQQPAARYGTQRTKAPTATHQLQQLLLKVVVLLAHVLHKLADGGLAAAACREVMQSIKRQGVVKGPVDPLTRRNQCALAQQPAFPAVCPTRGTGRPTLGSARPHHSPLAHSPSRQHSPLPHAHPADSTAPCHALTQLAHGEGAQLVQLHDRGHGGEDEARVQGVAAGAHRLHNLVSQLLNEDQRADEDVGCTGQVREEGQVSTAGTMA